MQDDIPDDNGQFLQEYRQTDRLECTWEESEGRDRGRRDVDWSKEQTIEMLSTRPHIV